MKHLVARLGAVAVLVLLITGLLALAGSGLVAAAGANPIRVLPDTVYPGQTFQVTVTFTSPADDFNAIGLADLAPAGWNVSVDMTECTPGADVDNHPSAKEEEADYIWFGGYDAGTEFTAVYNVTVPSDATPGTYSFIGGTLQYYIGSMVIIHYNPTWPTMENIAGDYQVVVTDQVDMPYVLQCINQWKSGTLDESTVLAVVNDWVTS